MEKFDTDLFLNHEDLFYEWFNTTPYSETKIVTDVNVERLFENGYIHKSDIILVENNHYLTYDDSPLLTPEEFRNRVWNQFTKAHPEIFS